jgi:hypothetical protein
MTNKDGNTDTDGGSQRNRNEVDMTLNQARLTRRNEVCPELVQGSVTKRAELDIAVAVHVRVRGHTLSASRDGDDGEKP